MFTDNDCAFALRLRADAYKHAWWTATLFNEPKTAKSMRSMMRATAIHMVQTVRRELEYKSKVAA